jgi:hypothetical protein
VQPQEELTSRPAQQAEERESIPYEEKPRWYSNPGRKKVIILLAVLVVIILLIVAIFVVDAYLPRQSNAPSSKKPPESDNSQITFTIPDSNEMTSRQLYLAYTTAKDEAIVMFDNQLVKVTGIIEVSGTSSGSRHFIILAGGIDNLGIHCTFPEGNSGKAGSLAKGQLVTIQGTCSGYSGTHVRLSDCIVAN